MNAQEQRALLERLAAACGYDTGHSMNASRMRFVPPLPALLVRVFKDGQPQLINTAWNPLDASCSTGGSEALELAARFRLTIGFDDSAREFGECAFACYRHEGRLVRGPMVKVASAGSAEQALCWAIAFAVIAQHEAGGGA